MVTTPVTAPPAVGTGSATPEVVVVTVTYNSAAVVSRFIRALPAALAGVASADVVVVDNASCDRTVERVRELAPWARVIEAGANLGYAAGINFGLQQVRPGHAAYVLNPDAVPGAGSARTLLDALHEFDDTGIVVPAIFDADGAVYHSLRREPTIRNALGAALLGGHRAGMLKSLSEVVNAPAAYSHGAVADWATGAAMMISRRTLDAAGPWAEDFFLYSEETDYALRARDHGFALRYVPGAVVEHSGGDMSRSPELWSIQAVNRVRLYRRRHHMVAAAGFWAAVALNEGIRAIRGSAVHRAGLKALFRGPPAVREQRRTLRDLATAETREKGRSPRIVREHTESATSDRQGGR